MNCRRFAAKRKGFLAEVMNRAAPTVSRRNFGKEKGAVMKFAKVSVSVSKTLVLCVALLLLASSGFAAAKPTLQLSHPVMVNGTTLQPGEYKVQWEGNGPNVEISILQGKNVVATAPAHVVELETPAPDDAAVLRKNDKGPNALAGIRFQGKKLSLELGEASDGMQEGSSK
jgi:hypothetical protein